MIKKQIRKPLSVHLPKRYGIIMATSLVIANMVGSGIFTTSGFMANYLPGPLWVLLCWFLGGLLALCGALSYSELASRMPESGGEYIFLKKLYHPLPAFLTGWTSFVVGFTVPIALSAMGFTAYFLASFSSELRGISSQQLLIIKKVTAVSIILLFTLIHYRGGRLGNRIHVFLTGINILLISLLVIAGFWFGKGSWQNLTGQFSLSWSKTGMGTAMVMVMYAFSGWNATAYVAGELKNSRKTILFSLVLGTLIVMVLYLGINLFVFYSTPYPDIRGVLTVVEKAAQNAFGNWTVLLINGLISAIFLASLGAFIVLGPRVYYAMSKDRLFFSFISGKASKNSEPLNRAILLQGLVAMVMVLVGSFEKLLIYLGFSLGIFPWLSVAGLSIARRKKIGPADSRPFKIFSPIPLFYLACSLVLMIFTYIHKPLESSTAIISILLGIPCYYLWIKWRDKKK